MPFRDSDYTPEQQEAIDNWPMPQTDEEMEAFLRFAQSESEAAQVVAYYRTGRKLFELNMLDAAEYAIRSAHENALNKDI